MIVHEIIEFFKENLNKNNLKSGDIFYYMTKNCEFKFLYYSDNKIYYLGMRGDTGYKTNYKISDENCMTMRILLGSSIKKIYKTPKYEW